MENYEEFLNKVRMSLVDSATMILDDLVLMDRGDNFNREYNIFESIVETIRYYSTPSQFATFMTDISEKHIKVLSMKNNPEGSYDVEVVDNDDGSATVTFEADQKTLVVLAQNGMKYALMREVLGADMYGGVTDDQFFSWAKNGKEMARIDEDAESL